jgi:hypothetical protein
MRANVITSLASGALFASLCGIASALPVAHQMHSTMSPMRQATPTTTTLSPAHATGQPNQSCGSATAPNTPGQAAVAPGSAFNPDGKAGTVYAGQQPQNSRNTASVSQYDVACFHQR